MGLYDRDYVRASRMPGIFASRVYGWMTLGLGVTTFVILSLYYSGLYRMMFPFWWVWCLATLGVSLLINSRAHTLSLSGVMTAFLAYSALEGMFFGTVLPVYAAAYGGNVIWASFGTAGGIFGIAALYGTMTRNDLTQISKILFLALCGLVGVSFVFMILSFFFHMPLAYLFICYLGLAVFVGLTITDAQAIRKISERIDQDSELAYKLALVVALKMYCNVIMICWYTLQIFASSSGRRD